MIAHHGIEFHALLGLTCCGSGCVSAMLLNLLGFMSVKLWSCIFLTGFCCL